MSFRYSPPAKNWYKGSLHLHTTRSDGHLTDADLTEKYAAANFNFIALTDHWQGPDPAAKKDAYSPLILDGVELEMQQWYGNGYHLTDPVCPLNWPAQRQLQHQRT